MMELKSGDIGRDKPQNSKRFDSQVIIQREPGVLSRVRRNQAIVTGRRVLMTGDKTPAWPNPTGVRREFEPSKSS